MSSRLTAAASFIRRNEKKLLLIPVLLLPLAVAGALFLIQKPEPLEFPPTVPRSAAPASSSGGVAGPAFQMALQTYQALEQKVYSGVGMPEADREAFNKAREQIQLCNEGADAGIVKLDECIAEHLRWLVDSAAADLRNIHDAAN